MELIYTTRTSGFEPGKNYRNPRHFVRADSAATSVVLDGDYPDVRKAYEAANVPVSGTKASKPSDDAPKNSKPADEIDKLRDEYEERFGEKPHARMKASTLREKLEAE